MKQTTMDNLTSEQRKLVEEILRREDRQRKVDECVDITKLKTNLDTIRRLQLATDNHGQTSGPMNLR